jgi:uncharacterized protein (TIGR04141 family)
MNIIPNIFKIDKKHRLLRSKSITRDIIIAIIKDFYNKSEFVFRESDIHLKPFIKREVKYYLYLHRNPDRLSDWANFFPEELRGDLNTFYQTKISLILFIETEFELYAVVGGNAYKVIVNYIDHQFGLNMYDRIICLEEDEAASTKSRGIIGQRIGLNEQFREDYKMINYLQFGKIPKELNIKLSPKTAYGHFSFLMEKKDERFTITVGKGFKVNRSVDFESLNKVIQELTVILELAPQELLSSYIQIRDADLIKKFEVELNRRIYNNIAVLIGNSTNPNDHFEFDFCSPNNLEAFYDADSYQLKEKVEDKHVLFATLTDRTEIYRTVVLHPYEKCGNDQQSILFYLRGVRVHCIKGSRQSTSSTFLYHLNAEITYMNDSVFYIDTKWYRLKDGFLKSLNHQTELLFRNFKLQDNILGENWPIKTDGSKKLIDEGDYNNLYIGKDNYIVMDTITPEGVEICDILYIKDSELYLIHVKHSFTARVRELTNQIQISARRVSEAVSSNNRLFFGKAYDSIVSKMRTVNNLNQDEFIDLFFKSKKIHYVFATASQFESNDLIEENLSKYKSNIAKFSLTTCSSEVQTQYSNFLVFQIMRQSAEVLVY